MKYKCYDCKQNNRCKKPYECEPDIQKRFFGRVFTKKEWDTEGNCLYFESNIKTNYS